MESLHLYSRKTIKELYAPREGEIKFGDRIRFLENSEDLQHTPGRLVLLGIPEDIGVRANYGVPGTAKAWETCLKHLLNIQHNRFTHPEDLILLGALDCSSPMQKAGNIDQEDPNYREKLGDLVQEIDAMVSRIVKDIIAAGKFPVIIGGGHNNAYGNIKGTAMALEKQINVLNLDAHTDLRRLEHRHSGNGFSFAFKEGFLKKYAVFGLSRNYTPQYIFEAMEASENISFRLFEELPYDPQSLMEAFKEQLDFVRKEDFGLEIDCDVIRDFPSSAKSPSGFSLEQIRSFITLVAGSPHCRYLHLCEAAPEPDQESQIGKALAYLITDFHNSLL